jgi:tripartite-type tricarboxylate transporter receptor subunit TctC
MLVRAFTCAALLASLPAWAEDRSVRILVGFPPGGAADLVARLVAERMKVALAANVLVDNRPGGAGQLAARLLKAAPADGKTLMLAPPAPIVWATLTNPALDYDPQRDFAPVSLAASFDLALITGPGVPATSFPDYVSWAKEDPRRRNYGTGAGGLPHLFGILLGRSIGVELSHVGYKGGAQLLKDVAGGHIPAGISVLAEAIPLHQAGRVRILATSGSGRFSRVPDVPTFSELGLPNITGGGWMAFFVPAATPAASIRQLSDVIAGAMNAPEVKERLLLLGFEPVGSSPEKLATRIQEDTAKWGPIARDAALAATR